MPKQTRQITHREGGGKKTHKYRPQHILTLTKVHLLNGLIPAYHVLNYHKLHVVFYLSFIATQLLM